MRILLVHNYYQDLKNASGEAVVFETEKNLLLAAGHEVTTFTRDNSNINSFLDRIKASFCLFYNYQAKQEFKSLLNSFQPDIVHVHNYFPLLSVAIFDACNELNIPVVITLHNYRLFCPSGIAYLNNAPCTLCQKRFFSWPSIYNKCYKNSYIGSFLISFSNLIARQKKTWQAKINGFIALTNFSKELYLNSVIKIPENKIYLNYNSVEDYGFSTDKEDYYLFIGRLNQNKGILTTLEAFKNKKETLLIIGKGPLEDTVIDYSEKYQNIKYLSNQPKESVYALLKSSKALIMASNFYETGPLVLYEALSTGTPVIASNIAHIPELVIDNYNGFLFKPNCSMSLSEKIDLFSSLPEAERKYLCENARKTYEQFLSIQNHGLSLVNIYNSVILNSRNA